MEQPEYTPHGAAKQLFETRDREIVIEGPAGTGKSRAVLEKINTVLNLYPGARALIVRDTRVSMSETVLVTLEKIVLCEGHPALGTASRAHRTTYDYPNGSTIVTGGMDNADRLMSSEYDIIGVFEATEITLEDWEKLLTRLRNGVMPYQQAIADCNPAYPQHWINRRAMSGSMTRLLSRHADNPKVTQEYLNVLRALTGSRRARLFDGRWAGEEGVVYDTFDKGIHVKRRDERWSSMFIGVDDGHTNPFVALLCGVDGDGRVHALREFYQPGTLLGQRVAAVRDMGQYTAIVDPSAATLIAELRSAGVHVVGADNDVVQGIYRVQERLRRASDGEPRFTLDPSCTHTITEFESYRWKTNNRAMTDDGKWKDEPVKEQDHAMDALRYVVAHVDGKSDVSATWVEPGRESKQDRRQKWLMGDE